MRKKKLKIEKGDERDLEVERLINEELIDMETGQPVVEVDFRKSVKKKKNSSLEDEPIYFVRS